MHVICREPYLLLFLYERRFICVGKNDFDGLFLRSVIIVSYDQHHCTSCNGHDSVARASECRLIISQISFCFKINRCGPSYTRSPRAPGPLNFDHLVRNKFILCVLNLIMMLSFHKIAHLGRLIILQIPLN